ncbi:unnamed protein product [Caenorhabditis bovis]|uniref:Galectin n=1 Tax=Caenorhabditis bovis TaxID=2654633 RepID=A0A8S1F5B9_9PELO|nr:unnamed protein product [Caenorhabditis bovis]
MVHIIENPVIPLSTPIYQGLHRDSTIHFHGDVYPGPQGGFIIEFLVNNGVAFHVSVRMGTYGQNCIAFNHMKHGRWHREEHHQNRIYMGQPFRLTITNCHKKYEVSVNGHCIGHYHHHVSPAKIHVMNIRGDVRISQIHFENFPDHNGGGTQVGLIAPAPVIVQPQPAPVQVIPQPPIVQPVYPALQPIVYPTATPVIYSQPEVIYIENDHHHHHHRHHHC